MSEIDDLKARLARVEAQIAALAERVQFRTVTTDAIVPRQPDWPKNENLDPNNLPEWATRAAECIDDATARGIVADNRHSVHSPGYPRSAR